MRKNLNINDELDKKVNTYIQQNGMNYTAFINMAISEFFTKQDLQNEFKNMFKNMIQKQVDSIEDNK